MIYGNLIQKNSNNKGNIISYYENDFAEVIIPNQASKLKFKNGDLFVYYTNGDIKKVIFNVWITINA